MVCKVQMCMEPEQGAGPGPHPRENERQKFPPVSQPYPGDRDNRKWWDSSHHDSQIRKLVTFHDPQSRNSTESGQEAFSSLCRFSVIKNR